MCSTPTTASGSPLPRWPTSVRTTGFEQVPVFYRGPYAPEAFEHLKDGPSTFDPKQIREGFVIRLATPRYHELPRHPHVVLKSVGEEYLLRKGGTEYH
jgi:hypothetical protein